MLFPNIIDCSSCAYEGRKTEVRLTNHEYGNGIQLEDAIRLGWRLQTDFFTWSCPYCSGAPPGQIKRKLDLVGRQAVPV